MNHFLDSCVIIGFIFYQADRWGCAATNVIKFTPEKKHYGYFVHNECFGEDGKSGRCNTIMRQINFEFRKAISNLKENQSIDLLLLDAEKWTIYTILKNDILSSFQGNFQLLEEELRNYQRMFEFDCITKQREVKKIVMRHYRREPYKQEYSSLKRIVPDVSDIENILDAYDIAQYYENVVFITGDGKDILRYKDQILSIVKIADIYSLDQYNN